MIDKNEILEYVKNELSDDEGVIIDENTSLFKDRILDSLNLISLISFIEKKHSVKISPSEVTLENLDSVSNMADFIEKKLKV